MGPKYTDIELIQGIKNNDDRCLNALYKDTKIRDLIFAHIKNNSGNYDDATDIYQETIIFLFEKLQTNKEFELTSSLSTYLFGVAKFKWLKKLTNNTNIKSLPDGAEEYIKDDSEVDGIDNERIALINLKIENMKSACKELLTNFYFNKMTMIQLAERLGYNNEDSAKAMKHKCMKTLKEMIANTKEQC